MRNIHKIGKNIYITTDEEIKEGDYYLYGAEIIQANGLVGFHISLINACKKIILTTKQDIIKDGVQAIDDEFLEWFAKNPSCEEVEVVSKDFYYDKEYWYTHYKTIIPKEESLEEALLCWQNKQIVQQQGLCKIYLPNSNYLNLSKNEIKYIFNQENKGFKPKQETLEEAAERLVSKSSITEVAKWQQERSYSEEEVYHILCEHTAELFKGSKLTLTEWFKQFKKQIK